MTGTGDHHSDQTPFDEKLREAHERVGTALARRTALELGRDRWLADQQKERRGV